MSTLHTELADIYESRAHGRYGLALQGGPLSAREVCDFEATPFWREAVALRRVDEAAKAPNGPAPEFADFLHQIIDVAR